MQRFLFRTVLPLVVLGAILYPFRAQIVDYATGVWAQLQGRFAPCKEPIPYVLGTFDAKFGISKTYFLSALAEAEAVWERPFGKELFTYGPESTRTSDLKINLIYDYRQEATSKLASLGIKVDESKASYDALKVKFEALQKKYNSLESDYERRVEVFEIRNAEYQKNVNYWNKRKGAPPQEYEALEEERIWLEAEAKNLNAMQDDMNEFVDEINSMVVILNRMASSLNLAVDKYNTVGASRGESFEEGVFASSGLSREIDIYEFSSREKLVRVLAHELGHALGLAHVDDPKAIMYSLNKGNTIALAEADLSALKAKCEVK